MTQTTVCFDLQTCLLKQETSKSNRSEISVPEQRTEARSQQQSISSKWFHHLRCSSRSRKPHLYVQLQQKSVQLYSYIRQNKRTFHRGHAKQNRVAQQHDKRHLATRCATNQIQQRNIKRRVRRQSSRLNQHCNAVWQPSVDFAESKLPVSR